MKKFKNRKQLLIHNEFKQLAFELLREEGFQEDDYTYVRDEEIENRIDKFVERKIKHCKNLGI